MILLPHDAAVVQDKVECSGLCVPPYEHHSCLISVFAPPAYRNNFGLIWLFILQKVGKDTRKIYSCDGDFIKATFSILDEVRQCNLNKKRHMHNFDVLVAVEDV